MTNFARPPRVVAIVVTYNGAPWIERCLRSLLAEGSEPDIIVVDNASADHTVDIVESIGASTLIRNPQNIGFGRANNIGLAKALDKGAEYVFLLNQDCWVAPGAIQTLIAACGPGVGVASGVQVDEAGDFDYIQLRSYLSRFAPEYFADLRRGTVRPHYDVEDTGFAACLFSREVLETVGGFDPLYFLYREDNDYCRRTRYHGFSIRFVPAALFTHVRAFHAGYARQSTRRKIVREIGLGRSELIFWAKDPEGRFIPNLIRSIASKLFTGLDDAVQKTSPWPLISAVGAIMAFLPDLRTVYRHRRQCCSTGRHWLDPAADQR
jgi:GT2 family glycosyltransferase